MGRRANATLVVKAAYADSEPVSWLRGIVGPLAALVADHAGTVACIVANERGRLRVRHAVASIAGRDDGTARWLAALETHAPGALACLGRVAFTASQLKIDLAEAAHDRLIVPAVDDRSGVIVAFALKHPRSPTRREERLFAIIGAHLLAGFKFRLAAASRDELREHALAVDSAAASRYAATHGLERGLLDGTWRVVERFDGGGKRYLLARKLPQPERSRLTLTGREAEAITASLQGRSTKQIAYEFGLATSTVCDLLQTAMLKLGVRNRAELAEVAAEVMLPGKA
jgi:DNA-binding CsgD family transcriptional regulator